MEPLRMLRILAAETQSSAPRAPVRAAARLAPPQPFDAERATAAQGMAVSAISHAMVATPRGCVPVPVGGRAGLGAGAWAMTPSYTGDAAGEVG